MDGWGEPLTRDSQLENGIPLSREKAQIWRDDEASELMVIMRSSARMMEVRAMVAPVEPVAFWKT